MLNFIKNLFNKKQLGGCLPLPDDEGKDFKLGIFGFEDYRPKSQEKWIQTLSVKTQKFNTCTFASAVVAKEVDEGVRLSVRFLVCLGRREGIISGDGYSNLRAVQLLLQKYGCCEERLLSEGNNNITWEEYSNPLLLTQERIKNAALHKTQSFWKISNKNEALKALDDCRPLVWGSLWKTNFNMNGGFSFPWILDYFKGQSIGGHAIEGGGYKVKYQEKQVLSSQNSYGANYGDGAKFYVLLNDFEKQINTYGCFINSDISKDAGKFLRDNNGKLIKSKNTPDVWFIENGKKRWFEDELVLWAYGFKLSDITEDSEDVLPQIERGNDFVFEQGKDAQRLKEVLRGMPSGRTQELAKKRFPELFN